MCVGSNMSISKEEKKARNMAKNRLNKELSLVQLLYLVNQYNWEDDVNIHTSAVISHNVVVETGAHVGALSFVIKKVKAGTTVMGNPAKKLF